MAKKKTRISNVTHTSKKSRDLAKKNRLKKKPQTRKQPLEFSRNQTVKKTKSKPAKQNFKQKKSKPVKAKKPKSKKIGSWHKLTSERALEKLQKQYLEREKSLRKQHAKEIAKLERQGKRYDKALQEYREEVRRTKYLESLPVFVTKKVLRWFKKHRGMSAREVYTYIHSPPTDAGMQAA